MPDPKTTERTEEYRVVVKGKYGVGYGGPVATEQAALEAAAYYPPERTSIQTRKFTTTPWVDLDEGEG